MRTIVRSTALTLVALALALVLPNTASADCEGFADVPEDAACYLLKYLRADDGFVIAFHIILRNFSLVDLFLLGEEVHRVGLLKKRVALVLLVGKNAANGPGIPFVFPTRGLDAIRSKAGGNAVNAVDTVVLMLFTTVLIFALISW